MNRFALLGAAAATIVAVGLGGWLLSSRTNSPDLVGSTPSTSPAPSPSPAPSVTPSASLPPPLTDTFHSSVHGISIRYPAGWQARAATEPWTRPGWAGFDDPAADILFDPSVDDGHLFISLASSPLAGAADDQWTADTLALPEPQGYGCGSTAPVTVDGAPGYTGCHAATVAVGGRGYLILLYTSDDEPSNQALYDQAWFETLLATVDLRPDGVVEPVSSPAG
jgi:hypothetical protein